MGFAVRLYRHFLSSSHLHFFFFNYSHQAGGFLCSEPVCKARSLERSQPSLKVSVRPYLLCVLLLEVSSKVSRKIRLGLSRATNTCVARRCMSNSYHTQPSGVRLPLYCACGGLCYVMAPDSKILLSAFR